MQPPPASTSGLSGRSSLPPSASFSTRRLPSSWADSPVVPDKRSSSTSDPWSTATSARKKVRAADWKGKGRADSVEAVGFSRANGVFLGSSLPRSSLGRPRHSEPTFGYGRVKSEHAFHPLAANRGSQPSARSTPSDYGRRRKSDLASPPRNLRPVPEIGNQPTKIQSTRGPAPLDLLFGGDLPTQPPSRGSSTAPPLKEERPARPPASTHPELFAPSKHPVPTFPKSSYSHAPTRIRRPKSPPRFQPVDEVNKAQREALLKVKEQYGPVAELRAKLEQRPAPQPPAEMEPARHSPRGSPELYEGVEIPRADSADEECVDGTKFSSDDEMSDPAPVSSSKKQPLAIQRDGSTGELGSDCDDLCTPAERPLPLQPRGRRRPLRYKFPKRDIRHLDLDGEAGEVVANPLRRKKSVSSLASSTKDELGKKDGPAAGPSAAKAATTKKQAKPKQVQRRDQKLEPCRSFVTGKKDDEADWYARDYSGADTIRPQISRIASLPQTSHYQLIMNAQSMTLPAAMCARLRSVGGRNYVTATFETSSAGGAQVFHSTRGDLRIAPLSHGPLVEAGARAYQVLDAAPFSVRLSLDQASRREQLVIEVSLDIAGVKGTARRPLDALLVGAEHTVVLSNQSSLSLAVSVESARDIRRAAAAVEELSTRMDAIALNAEHPDGVWIPDPVAIRGHTAPASFPLPDSVPGQVGFDFATKLPYNVGAAVPFLADETVEAMRPYFKANNEAISRTAIPLKEKLIARMQTRWCLVNPYPYTSYHRELACWRYYAPVVHHFSLRLELALHLVERLLRHDLLSEPQLREVLHTYDREVKRIEAGYRSTYDEWREGGPS